MSGAGQWFCDGNCPACRGDGLRRAEIGRAGIALFCDIQGGRGACDRPDGVWAYPIVWRCDAVRIPALCRTVALIFLFCYLFCRRNRQLLCRPGRYPLLFIRRICPIRIYSIYLSRPNSGAAADRTSVRRALSVFHRIISLYLQTV